MARWKLTEPHYLNVPGTRWELIMNDRQSGRPVRKVYEVPRFLHPEDPQDWNHGNKRDGDGYIVVCHKDKGHEDDIVFIGAPTPGMLPIDEEAQKITAGYAKVWTPTTGTDEQAQMESFQQKLLNGLVDQMQTQTAQMPQATGFEKMMETMMAMMQQQTQILAAIAGKSVQTEFARQAAALGEAPVEAEAAEPLDDLEPTAEEVKEAALAAHEREAASAARAKDHALAGRR